MRGKSLGVLFIASMGLFGASATAATTTDTFDGGTSSAGWSYGFDAFETSGGNPGAWLHAINVDTFGPRIASDPTIASDFTGDLRAKGVTSMSLDARVDATQFPYGGEAFVMTLLLRNTRGTPEDFSDDDYAYFAGDPIPQPGTGWLHYNFPVPSAQTTLPTGWKGGSAEDPENFRPGVTWNDIITKADIVEFNYLKPGFFAIFQQWDTGVDNISVTSVPEPASMGVIAMIGAGLVARRRR